MIASLQLDLFEDVVSLPWYGRSPRSLTRSYKRFIFKAETQKDDRYPQVDPSQIDMFVGREKAPWKYQGAPLLSPLER